MVESERIPATTAVRGEMALRKSFTVRLRVVLRNRDRTTRPSTGRWVERFGAGTLVCFTESGFVVGTLGAVGFGKSGGFAFVVGGV